MAKAELSEWQAAARRGVARGGRLGSGTVANHSGSFSRQRSSTARHAFGMSR